MRKYRSLKVNDLPRNIRADPLNKVAQYLGYENSVKWRNEEDLSSEVVWLETIIYMVGYLCALTGEPYFWAQSNGHSDPGDKIAHQGRDDALGELELLDKFGYVIYYSYE